VIKTPQPATLSTGVIIGQPDSRTNSALNTPFFPGFNNRNRQQMDMYERDRMEVERRNREMQHIYNDMPDISSSIYYDLPFMGDKQGTEHYFQAAKKLLDMLEGKTPLDLQGCCIFRRERIFRRTA